ncbi:L,D-transpeptidase family protein [Planctomycetaceae bacterium]|jgi:LysM repeat protein|nr:L,D-transpeptidase family protein [Planctomycetaceae bacterium]MDC0273441.1 L,D-transpeptidase family protein [Planctomycetaceae bacterium]
MRQPIRQRRESKDWIVSGGLTTLFVVGSLWYLDFLPPLDQWVGSSEPTTVAEDGTETTLGNNPLEEFLAQQDEPSETTEAVPPAPTQSEPTITTLGADNPAIPANAVSYSKSFPPQPEQPPSNTAYTSDPSPQNTRSNQNTISLSEQERIARIFGVPQTTPPEKTASNIVPASAEKPAAPEFPLTSNNPYAEIDAWIAEGQFLKAHRELSQQYWKEEQAPDALLTRLNKTAGMIYFAPQPHFMQAYEIKPGDLLQKVAPNYSLSWEYLTRLNRVRPERVKVGQKLKVIKGPFSAFIDLSDFSLTIHAHGYFVKRYDIGIGAENSTPIGTFSVKEKLKNPTYYGPDGVIDAEDANNPLGERWVDIGDSYGIHGTIDPNSIKKAESRGCLRLNNEDIVEVYDFLTTGSEVVIRP